MSASFFSEIEQEVKSETYEAAYAGRPFTIICWRLHGGRIKLYRLLEKSGFWVICGI